MSGLYVIFARDKAGAVQLRLDTRPAHLEHAQRWGDRIKLGGPMLDDAGQNPCGSVLIIEADSLEQAQSFVADDPYYKAGLFESVTVTPWRKTLGGWGAAQG